MLRYHPSPAEFKERHILRMRCFYRMTASSRVDTMILTIFDCFVNKNRVRDELRFLATPCRYDDAERAGYSLFLSIAGGRIIFFWNCTTQARRIPRLTLKFINR